VGGLYSEEFLNIFSGDGDELCSLPRPFPVTYTTIKIERKIK